jgi:hypothetical protein
MQRILLWLLLSSAAPAQPFAELGRIHAAASVGEYAAVSLVNLDATAALEVVLLAASNTSASSAALKVDVRRDLVPWRRLPFGQGNVLVWFDVDADGDLDAFVGRTSAVHGLYLNQGDGVFADEAGARLGGLSPDVVGAVAVDVDGDGRQDLAVAHGNAPPTLLLNRGGYLNPSANLPAGIASRGSVLAADIDGDGDRDLLFLVSWRWYANAYGPAVLCVNDGSGVFVDRTPRLSSEFVGGAAMFGDVDRDGDVDLIVPGHTWSLQRNDGRGFFGPATGAFPADLRHAACHLVDLDRDGDLDVVATGDDRQATRWLVNDGGGRFASGAIAPPAACCTLERDLAVGDLDGDGDADLVLVSGSRRGGNVATALRRPAHVLFQVGPGSFVDGAGAALHNVAPGVLEPVVGDLDGDGFADLVFNHDAPFGLQLLRNDGTGSFKDRSDLIDQMGPTPHPSAAQRGTFDLDNDGDQDLVFNGSGQYVLWRNDNGVLQFVRSGPGACTPFDADGDGDVDLFTYFALELNQGNWTWRSVSMPGPANVSSHAVDLDADGDLDLVVGGNPNVSPSFAILINRGGATFVDETAARVGVSNAAFDPLVGDFDGDGDPDVVVDGAFQMQILRNDGQGTFGLRQRVGPLGGERRFAVDLEGDGDLDLAVGARGSSPAVLYLNGGSGTFTPVVLPGLDLHAAFDVDRDGDIDLVTSGGATTPLTMHSNLDRHVFVERIGFVGTATSLRFSSRPQRASAGDFVVPLIAVGLAPPQPVPGIGVLMLPAASLVVLPAQAMPVPAGSFGLDLPVPDNPGLVGTRLGVQGLFARGGRLVLGNAAAIELAR